MPREIRLNAFDMNCVGHIQHGMWAHPRDRSMDYTDLDHWVNLARTLENGLFDGLFLADILGVYDVYHGLAGRIDPQRRAEHPRERPTAADPGNGLRHAEPRVSASPAI